MSFHHNFKFFFVFSFLSAQAQYYPTHNRKKFYAIIIRFIPVTVLLTVLLYSCYEVLPAFNIGNRSTPEGPMLYILTLGSFVPNICTIFRGFFWFEDTHAILEACDFVAAYTKKRLNDSVSEFRKTLLRRMVIVFIFLAGNHVVRLAIPSPVLSTQTALVVFIMQLYKVWTLLHVTFYIDLLKLVILSINTEIVSVEQPMLFTTDFSFREYSRTEKQSLKLLSSIKVAYIKLYDVIKLFNTQFGWIMISVLTETSSYAINSAYWVYVVLVSFDRASIVVWRKYKICCIFFVHFSCLTKTNYGNQLISLIKRI